MSTMIRNKTHLAEASLPYSVSGFEVPFFRLPYPEDVPIALPYNRKATCSGLVTRSTLAHLKTLEIYFNPQRSWASPFKALLLSSDQTCLLACPFAHALGIKTPQDLYPALQRFDPTQEAVLLFAPQSSQGRASCSLGLSDLPGSLSNWLTARSSPSCCSPLVLDWFHPLESNLPVPQGFTAPLARLFPKRDAGLLGLDHKLSPTTSLEDQQLMGYFFTSLQSLILRQ